MRAIPLTPANLTTRLVAQPLTLPHFAVALGAAVFAATVYCQLYCATAFQEMGGMSMPLSASLAWALTAVFPWLACLELAKRRWTWTESTAVRCVMIGALFITAAATSIVLELGLDQLLGVHHTRPLPMQIASQFPAAGLTAALLLAGPRFQARTSMSPDAVSPVAQIVAMSSSIEWIEAAGNYVQVHTSNGASLYRATMRQLEQTLDRKQFRRIHRSIIVNVAAVESRVLVRGAPAVRLTDGTLLKLGGRYTSDSFGRSPAGQHS